MFNRLLFILIAVSIGWFLREYFSAVTPSKRAVHPSQDQSLETVSSISTAKIISTHKEIQSETLEILLAQNRFNDALTFYLEANNENSVAYRIQIEDYLMDLVKIDVVKALEYMEVFLYNVAESNIVKLMIKTYIAQGDFSKAIALIIQVKENYSSEEEDKRVSEQLENTAKQFMEILNDREAYAELISFLEDMIAYDSTDSFYSFHLAQLYLRLDKIPEASLLLDELQYDEVYGQNVKTLLQTIDIEEEGDAYKYTIPLERYGDHFSVKVFLDGSAFNLMLDTGATYIFIDEDKASMLEVLRDDLVLQTAGNDVSAKLCQASTMRIGNLQLANIKITVAPFKRQDIDGLLGMNFLKQFKFFIDQDEGILYLDPK